MYDLKEKLTEIVKTRDIKLKTVEQPKSFITNNEGSYEYLPFTKFVEDTQAMIQKNQDLSEMYIKKQDELNEKKVAHSFLAGKELLGEATKAQVMSSRKELEEFSAELEELGQATTVVIQGMTNKLPFKWDMLKEFREEALPYIHSELMHKLVEVSLARKAYLQTIENFIDEYKKSDSVYRIYDKYRADITDDHAHQQPYIDILPVEKSSILRKADEESFGLLFNMSRAELHEIKNTLR